MARKAATLVPIMTRLPEATRAKLAREAERGGRSLNGEIVFRLQKSLSEEASFGGAELRDVAVIMAAAFSHAGRLRTPDKPPAVWLKDKDTYAAAIASVVEHLLVHFPGNRDPAVAIQIFEAAKRRVVTRSANERARP